MNKESATKKKRVPNQLTEKRVREIVGEEIEKWSRKTAASLYKPLPPTKQKT